MRGKKVKKLRKIFQKVVGRPPLRATLGGTVTRFVDKVPEKGQPLEGPVRATLYEKVVFPSEWRRLKHLPR